MARKGEKWSEQERQAHEGRPLGWIDPKDGYWRIKIGRKQVLLHRYMMEQHLGRTLDRRECVHHVNGNRSDNRIENLRVIPLGEHIALHSIGSKRTPEARAKMRAAKLGTTRSEEAKRKTTESLLEYNRRKRENM